MDKILEECFADVHSALTEGGADIDELLQAMMNENLELLDKIEAKGQPSE